MKAWESDYRKPEALLGNFNLRIGYETVFYSSYRKTFALTDFSKQIVARSSAIYRQTHPLVTQLPTGMGTVYNQLEVMQQCLLLCDLIVAAKYRHHEHFSQSNLPCHILKHIPLLNSI